MSRYDWDRVRQLKRGEPVPADLFDAMQRASDLEASALLGRAVHVPLRADRRLALAA